MNRPVLYWSRSSKDSTAADNGWSTKLTDSVFAKLLERLPTMSHNLTPSQDRASSEVDYRLRLAGPAEVR